MVMAIERYLKDFSQPDQFVLSADLAPDSDPLPSLAPEPVEPVIPEEPAIDIEAERSAAFERGSKEAADLLAATHEAEMEAERSRHLEEINEMRTRFEQDISTTIAERFDQLAGELSEQIGAQVARVIAPFLEQALSEQMIAQLAEALAPVLSDREGMHITVSGSQSMFDSLQAVLGDKAAQLDFVEADIFDLTVKLEDTVLSTRLTEWADTLREILA
ncbi:MAG: hypothetical protein NXI27_18020 [Alphaproteobacteria bacterium]|nr:hypothetical protein [Alphaproteobacteria bacterium]